MKKENDKLYNIRINLKLLFIILKSITLLFIKYIIHSFKILYTFIFFLFYFFYILIFYLLFYYTILLLYYCILLFNYYYYYYINKIH